MTPTPSADDQGSSDNDGDDSGGTTQSSAADQLREQAYKVALGSAALLLAAATVFYHFVESWTWVDAFYFSSVAITTVGFGDLSPTTDASKLFTVFYIFMGLSLVGVVLNEAMRRRAIRHDRIPSDRPAADERQAD